jgi:hypothetical protein
MSKSFTHAGVSKLDGQFKVRFCNDALRQKVLIKNGHTDIDILELKHAMSKEDAVAYLLSIDFATRDGKTNEAVQAALLAEVDKRSEKPKAADKQPKKTKEAKKPKKEPAKKVSLESIKAKAKVPTVDADLEDAPF